MESADRPVLIYALTDQDTGYVDLIERYAKAEGVELKDVVNLAFHEFFERRQYLPEDRP
jgi:hypothetical protein